MIKSTPHFLLPKSFPLPLTSLHFNFTWFPFKPNKFTYRCLYAHVYGAINQKMSRSQESMRSLRVCIPEKSLTFPFPAQRWDLLSPFLFMLGLWLSWFSAGLVHVCYFTLCELECTTALPWKPNTVSPQKSIPVIQSCSSILLNNPLGLENRLCYMSHLEPSSLLHLLFFACGIIIGLYIDCHLLQKNMLL